MSIRPSLRCRSGLVGLACFLFASSLYAQDNLKKLDLVEQLSAQKHQFLARRLMLVDSTEQVVFFDLYRDFNVALVELDQKKLSLRRAFFDQIHSQFGPTTASALVLAEVDWQREIGRLIEEYRQGNPGFHPLSTENQ